MSRSPVKKPQHHPEQSPLLNPPQDGSVLLASSHRPDRSGERESWMEGRLPIPRPPQPCVRTAHCRRSDCLPLPHRRGTGKASRGS